MVLSGGMKLAPLITEIKVDIKGFKSEMSKVKTEAVLQANKVSKEMEKTVKVGEKMSSVGGTLTKALTVPLAGASVAAAKMSTDFESSFAKVSTLLDRNVVDYEKYKDELLNASSDSKTAVEDFSEAVYSSISAGVDQTKAIGFTTSAIKLAKGGFTDAAKAVDVMTTAINGYSLKTEDATRISDLLITTQNLGKTTVDELASSMGKVIPIASSVNFGIEELSASYAQLTKNGIATAEAGTYLKAMLSELGKSGSVADETLRELTGKGFADLKKEGMATAEILKLLENYASENDKSLKDMFGSIEAGSAALVLARKDGTEYNEMLASMENAAGATQSAFDKMDATPAEQLKGSLNELKNSAIKLGQSAIPVVVGIADKLGELVDSFNDLEPAQQENIIKFGMLAAATGPVLKATGGLIKGYGQLRPLMSKTNTLIKKGIPVLGEFGAKLATTPGTIGKIGASLSTLAPATAGSAAGVGSLVSALGGVVTAAAPVVLGAGAITAGAYGIYKCLSDDVIPTVDVFKNETIASFNAVSGQVEYTTVNINEETKKQMQAYIDLSNTAQQESMNMYSGITAITDENVASITGKINDMSVSIINSATTQRDEVISGFQTMFENTTVITAEEQAEIIETVNKGCQERIEATTKLKEELVGIYNDIAKQGGDITEKQQQRIDEIYNEMKNQAVQAMIDNEAEQNVIMNRLSQNQQSVTAEMVSESIKQMNELRNKSVQSASEKRDALVLEAEKLKLIEGGKYEEKANQIIEAANSEYEAVVENAEKIRTEGIDKLMSTHEDLANSIDVETGDIISKWDRLFGKWNKWQPEKKVTVIETQYVSNSRSIDGSHYNGLSYVPFDGYNARLHEGERVLTKKENEEYTQMKHRNNQGKPITINIPFNIDGREFAIATAGYTAEELGF